MTKQVESVVTIPELNDIREWVRKRNNLTYRAVTDITPFSALQADTLSHLRREWIEWQQDDSVVIRIPPTAECNQTKGTRGLGEYITDRQRPCATCRNTGQTNKFESTPPGGRQEPQHRKVVLHKRIAEPAIETLKQIFKTRGRQEIGIRRQGIQQIVRDISTSTALEREFTYNELMRTQLLIHAAHGLDLEVINEQSAFREQLNRRIIRQSEFDHPEITDRVGSEEFLRVIEHNAPVTIDTIADITNLVRRGVNDRLERLEQRDRVEVVKKEQVKKGPYKTQFFDVTRPPSDEFECRYGCVTTSESLRGIQSHESLVHE